MSNAIKFTPEDGAICLQLRPSDGVVAISVQDDGIGIAKEDATQLFQKFSQVGKGRTRLRGTGLGLALCKELVELHQGTMSLNPESGKGSTFTVTLPVYTDRLLLESHFRELVETAKRQGATHVGLLMTGGPDLPAAMSYPDAFPEAIRKQLSRDDIVLAVERSVLVLAIVDERWIQAIRRRLQQALREFMPSAASADRSVSIGVAAYPDDGEDVHALMARATRSLEQTVGLHG